MPKPIVLRFASTLLLGSLILWGVAPHWAEAATSPKNRHASPKSPTVNTTDQIFLALRQAAARGDYATVQKYRARLTNTLFAADAAYYDLSLQITQGRASQEEVQAFIDTHRKEFVAERLRQDWLRYLGVKEDFATFLALYNRERDELDPELACYRALAHYRGGNLEVLPVVRETMASYRLEQVGCFHLVSVLYRAQQLKEADMWLLARAYQEQRQLAESRVVLALLGVAPAQMTQLEQHPATLLAGIEDHPALSVLALAVYARKQPDKALEWLARNQAQLSIEVHDTALAALGVQMALSGRPMALARWQKIDLSTPLTLTEQEWRARAALRARDWRVLLVLLAQMPEHARTGDTWQYWRAYALSQLEQEPQLRQQLWEKVAEGQGFYPDLARLALQQSVSRTSTAPAANGTPMEKAYLRNALDRIQSLQALGLYQDMMTEWRWLVRDMGDDSLIALARLACERDMMDRCIAASQRTRKNINWLQRYPFYLKELVQREANSVGVSVPLVYGIMRQESRFVSSARSSAGAAGLMQLMPTTAALTARQYRVPYLRSSLLRPEVNVRLGVRYVKTVLDQFKGSWILAAAAYNAGPSRARLWQNSLTEPMEGAIFVETIPFKETRDYVKAVAHNAWVYGALLEQKTIPLNQVLGQVVPADGT